MGVIDKLKNKFQMGKGRTKQETGRATDDTDLEAEGRKERMAGGAKQASEQVKDIGKTVRDTFER